jgi:hypothetical protein
MNNDNQYPTYSGGLDQFYSSFWIQRRWILEIQIEGFDIKYEIYPLRYINQYFCKKSIVFFRLENNGTII